MELKSDSNEKKELKVKPSGGLKLSGVDTDEMREKAKATEKDVWDFSEDSEPIRVSSVESKLVREAGERKETDVTKIILIISQVILYALIIAEIVCLAYISYVEPVSIMSNTMKFKTLFVTASAYFIVDAILVNVLFEGKISLIFWAWLLPFVYPGKRQSHIKGRAGMGLAVSVIYFLSICGFAGYTVSQFSYYGGIIMEENAGVRNAAARVLEQPMDNGQKIGELFETKFSIEGVDAKKTGGNEIVVFNGDGYLSMNGDAFTRGMSQNIPTKITFIKADGSTRYDITEVTVGGTELSEQGIKNYWEALIKY